MYKRKALSLLYIPPGYVSDYSHLSYSRLLHVSLLRFISFTGSARIPGEAINSKLFLILLPRSDRGFAERMKRLPLFQTVDFHVHTHYSPCAQPEALPDVMVRSAYARGIRTMGFSDHYFPFTDPAIYDRVRREVGEIPLDLALYFGCEVDVLSPERFGLDAERAAAMDFVIAGPTHYQCDHVERPPVADPEACAAHYVATFTCACETPYVSFVAHPFHVPGGVFQCDPLAQIRFADLEPALRAAKQNDIAIEIQPKTIDPTRRQFYLQFYRMCKEMGLQFAFGSDGHRPAIAGTTATLKPLVDALGITDDMVWLPRRRQHDA